MHTGMEKSGKKERRKEKKFAVSCVLLCLSLFFSFCLKGEALDGKSEAVIDYTPYLKFTQR